MVVQLIAKVKVLGTAEERLAGEINTYEDKILQ